MSYRSILDGVLVQEKDLIPSDQETLEIKTSRLLSKEEKRDVRFGIGTIKHLKSNAIAIVQNQQLYPDQH